MPLIYRYSEFDDSILKNMDMEKLMNLWNQLILQSNGDVEQAERWLERLWERYDFFDGEYGPEDFMNYLKEEGYIREMYGQPPELTNKGESRLRTDALEEIFSSLAKGALGDHRQPDAGKGFERLPETRPYEFGDTVQNIAFPETIRNILSHSQEGSFDVEEEDIAVYDTEHLTSCATVLMVDISHSMILYGEDRITPAKKVAMALAELITTRYPKDKLDVVLFGDDAMQVNLTDLPYIGVGPYHTNTKAGLEMAQGLLLQRKQANKQIFMITDGKPSAIFEGGYLYKNSFGLDPKIVAQTLNEARACRRKNIVITTFMITDDPYLVRFVDDFTQANKGRAYYSQVDDLGSFIFADYVRNKKRRVGRGK